MQITLQKKDKELEKGQTKNIILSEEIEKDNAQNQTTFSETVNVQERSLPETEIVVDEFEVSEIAQENLNEGMDFENLGRTDSEDVNCMSEEDDLDSGNVGIVDFLKEIDNEWYTFVSNDENSDNADQNRDTDIQDTGKNNDILKQSSILSKKIKESKASHKNVSDLKCNAL